MLRKVGLISALMLALPTFANAWTITAKVGSGAGTIVSDSAAGTVARTATDRTAIVGYFKVDNTDLDQKINVLPEAGYKVSSVIVDGANVTASLVGNAYTVLAGSPAQNHTVAVYYTAETYKASVTQAAGGVVTIQALTSAGATVGSISVKEIANLKAGSKVRVKAAPNADYKVATVAGYAAKAGLFAGEADYKDVTVGGNVNYSASFTFVPKVTANIFALSNKGTVNTPIVVTASSVANGDVAYEFTPAGGTIAPFVDAKGVTIANKAIYTPTATTGTSVTVKATSNGAEASKTLLFTIETAAQNTNNVCLGCHTNRDSQIVANVAAKGLGDCVDCHTPSADKHSGSALDVARANWAAGTHNIANQPSYIQHEVSCASCHSTKHAQKAAFVTFSGANTVKSDTGCQTCHTVGKSYGIYSSQTVFKAPHYRGIASTSTGATADGQAKTQYVTQGMICADCHGHNNAINAEFAEGGHGKTSDIADNAFAHYDWATKGNDGSRSNSACDRCHTTYGFLKFANATTGLTRLQLVSGQPSAVLACITCHKTPEGELRTDAVTKDGSIKLSEGYKAKFIKGTITKEVQFPGTFKNSNICIPCHSGRNTGDVIVDYFKSYTSGKTEFYQHAANMGQTFIGTGAYQFDANNYASLPSHHTGVGTSVNTDKGPCVTCHNAHSLEVKDFSNCMAQYCHPKTFGEEDVTRAKTNYDAAVKVLTALVEAKIRPIFANPTLPITTERADVHYSQINQTLPNVTGTNFEKAAKAAGAWYNWHILTNADQAAYAHNPAYARAILLDTVDFLDDGVNNGSADKTVATSAAITSVEKLAAKGFATTQGCNGCHYEALATKHFANVTSSAKASFITARSECVDCHTKTQYHYSTPAVNAEWAESGHGAVTGLPFTGNHKWGAEDSCNACHTATGFRKFVASNFGDATKWTTGEGANETLSCKACHTDSSNFKGSVVTFGAYSAGMGGFGTAAKAKILYPDAGESNVCIPCHASRENGASLIAAGNASFTNPHYLAAAAVFYGKGGFQFYTSGVRYNTYGAAGKVGRNANWSHGKLGMDNYTTTTNATVKASGVIYGSGNKGQCVACHLGPNNTHTFGALEVATATFGTSKNTRGCYGCHTGTDMTMTAFIDEEKEIWFRMFDFFSWQLAQKGINYTDAYPYFSFNSGVTFANAVAGGDKDKTEGAAMNLKLLLAEKGSHVHNRSFGRALIADSIVYLQKGAVGDRTVADLNVNNIIKFSDYSAVRPHSYPGQVGPDVSIATLKSYLTKAASVPGSPVDGFARR